MAAPAVAAPSRAPAPSGAGRLALGALGVVFGDIGTSVLYSFQEIFAGPHEVEVAQARVMGAASLVFWTLTLIVSVKYVLIVMRADNDGEGGIMALTALTRRIPGLSPRVLAVLGVLGMLGAALFYGDGMITPAVSVLSAVEGLEVVDAGLKPWVVPIALVILVALFAAQRFGTHRVGAAFGPVMVVWFLVIAALGVASIVRSPGVLAAISPTYAIELIIAEPLISFLSLGSVVLCVTGAEALYADMGHFGRTPIRISWFALVAPALYLNYLGQAALIIRDPRTAENPFFSLVPDALLWPMVILATLATVIASQAVITGAFSMTEQAIRLHLLPRMEIRHTSAEQRGQIYVPFVNWALCIAVVALVLGFQDSSNLASAYGIAVTGTFVITTVMITVVARHKWQVPLWLLVPVSGLFFVIDLSFFAANLTKFDHGGWFPLAVAAVLFGIFATWRRGLSLLRAKISESTMTEPELVRTLAERPPDGPGTLVFVSADTRPPIALTEFLRRGGNLREHTIHLCLLVQPVPFVVPAEQLRVVQVAPGYSRAELRYGFMEAPDGNQALAALSAQVAAASSDVLVVFHSSRVVPQGSRGMALWRKQLFSFLLRNSSVPSAVRSLPIDDVAEWTSIERI